MLSLKIHEQQKEWAIKVAMGGALCVFCYIVMISPVFPEISALRQSIKDSQTRRGLYQEVQGLQDSLKKNERVLASLTERSQLLARISDLAGRSRIFSETLTPRTEPDGAYIKLRIDLDGRSDFFSLINFLGQVEKIGAEVRVRDVLASWSPAGSTQGDKDSLEIKLVFETLLMQRGKKTHV